MSFGNAIGGKDFVSNYGTDITLAKNSDDAYLARNLATEPIDELYASYDISLFDPQACLWLVYLLGI